MDTIFIEGLDIDALIGVHDWERRVRQPLSFDLRIEFDNRRAAASDAIGDTIDYAAVCDIVRAEVDASAYALLETLLEHLATTLLQASPLAQAVELIVRKPVAARALGCAGVGVAIRRERGAGR